MTFRTLIDAGALSEIRNRPDVAIIDCRFDLAAPEAGRAAYVAGHIPGARYADLNRDLAAPVTALTGRHPLPDPGTLARRLGELGVGNGSQVIAYDASSGSYAARLWWLLRWLGHPRVAVLDGGFQAWTAAGGTVQSGDVAPARTTFAPSSVAGASGTAGPAGTAGNGTTGTADAAQVDAARGDPDRLVVDARAAERFQGLVEPIDPVAGHVPGAVNHPFSANLGADGRFLSPQALRDRWQTRLGSTAPGNVIVMCGSGVTACHNLLSLEVAGLPGARLYAGSWSEWLRDPTHLVAPRDDRP